MTATTALTAQNTLGVEEIHVTPPAFVAKQINACLNDIEADVVKIGTNMPFSMFENGTDIFYSFKAC